MMIVMDCLPFANYFVPLIYNVELSQSALKGRRQLIAFAEVRGRPFFVVFFFPPLCHSVGAQKIGFASTTLTRSPENKQADVGAGD